MKRIVSPRERDARNDPQRLATETCQMRQRLLWRGDDIRQVCNIAHVASAAEAQVLRRSGDVAEMLRGALKRRDALGRSRPAAGWCSGG
jgi:hypothetical protein